MKYTIDQLLKRRLEGWTAREWVFLPMREFPFLRDQITVQASDGYHGLHGMSVILVCDGNTANQAYRIGDEVLCAGVLNLGIWHIGLNHIAELVFYNHRYQTPKILPIDAEWQNAVETISGVANENN